MDNIFKAQSKFGFFWSFLAKFPLNTGIETNYLTKITKNIIFSMTGGGNY